jgi:uncharacterized protein (TIRG00374 family)
LDLACILVSAWKWQRLLAALSVRVGLPALFRAYWIGAFVSGLLPSTVGGDFVRAALTRRHAGAGPVAASIIVERLTGLAVLLAIVLIVMLARPDLVAAGPLRTAVPLALGTGAAVLLLPVLLLARRRAPRATVPGRSWPGRVRALLATFGGALTDYARRGGALLVACAVSLAFYALIVLFQYAVVRALGLRVGLGDVAAVAPLVTLAAALPVSPNGLGVSEGVFVLLYARVGLSPEEALAAALLRRLILTLTAAAGGVLWLASAGARPAGR